MRPPALLAITALLVAGSGCQFAVKHPPLTAGIVVGSLGLAMCSLTTSIGEGDTSFSESGRAKCYGVTAIAALGIGAFTALALWLGYEDDDTPTRRSPDGTVGDPTNLEPAPVFVPNQLPKTESPKIEPPKTEPPKTEPPKPEPTPDPSLPPVDPSPVP